MDIKGRFWWENCECELMWFGFLWLLNLLPYPSLEPSSSLVPTPLSLLVNLSVFSPSLPAFSSVSTCMGYPVFTQKSYHKTVYWPPKMTGQTNRRSKPTKQNAHSTQYKEAEVEKLLKPPVQPKPWHINATQTHKRIWSRMNRPTTTPSSIA